MDNTPKLDQLLIQNLLDLDSAAKHIDELEDRIWRAICAGSAEWADGQGWKGEFDDTRSSIWTAPQDWIADGEKEAWFYFDFGPGDSGDHAGQWPYFYVTRYLGVGTGQMSLWLDQKVTSMRKWKPVAKSNAEVVAAGGFHLSDAGNFYMPCSLNPETVATALADDDLTGAMDPIREALSRAAEAKPMFDALIEQARQA